GHDDASRGWHLFPRGANPWTRAAERRQPPRFIRQTTSASSRAAFLGRGKKLSTPTGKYSAHVPPSPSFDDGGKVRGGEFLDVCVNGDFPLSEWLLRHSLCT